MTTALLLVATVRICFACPFGGGLLEDLPAGHPSVERRLADNRHWSHIVDPSMDGDSKWSNLWLTTSGNITGINDASQSVSLQALVNLSEANSDAEICYWSFQSLPGPGMQTDEATATVSDADVNMWFTAPPDDIGSDDDNYLDHAGQRMQAMITPGGPVVWQQGTVGKILRNRACVVRNGNSTFGLQADCNKAAVTNMQIKVPMSILIFKVQASKANESWDMMVKWRTNKSHGHYYEMNSNLIYSGWGQNGQVVSKAVMCTDIPDRYMYKNLYKGDILHPNGTQTWADESFDTWKSLCNLLKPNECPTTTTSSTSEPGSLLGGSVTNTALIAILLPFVFLSSGIAQV